ncbi:hypothetical protein ILUMI_12395 [Ignelater luminosus]|uniref:DDE-1 domain-containing protein n=1 Tax=Ignelater luminosus TaxID=2038154 RepID=A0A8K0CYN6_IGNLU|nr:hypothetical protein ILUMI_12395 [Ignelater luminosus]
MPRTRKLINRMMGNTPEDVMKEAVSKIHNDGYAFELAEKNKLKVPNSWKVNKIADEDWLKEFRKRWPQISIRKLEATVWPGLPALIEQQSRNETGLTTVLSQKGMKQVGQVTSGESGILITVCRFINAIGNTVPPFMIFPRVNFKPHMLNGSPAGTAGAATKSGWINGHIFLDVLKHFTNHVKCSKDNPVILFMDNHESHVQLEAITFAKDNGIILITFPPHTSSRLQPLDRTVYNSLKSNYNIVCNDWMLSNPGRTISIYDVARLSGQAYVKTVTPNNIINGFRWPLNRNIFSDDDFLSSYISDRNERDVSTINYENQTVESANNCTVQGLREKTSQPSTSKESFVSNEADPPLDNFKELTD